MNQPTHAWLAVEAYRKILALSSSAEGKTKKLDCLEKLLGANLRDVVVAAWLPDALIKDMTYGHVFKNSVYSGDQAPRFTLNQKELTGHLPKDTQIPKIAFGLVSDAWWAEAYRVKDNGGHLPARVNALCQTVRDMLRMGDADVVQLTGIKSDGASIIDDKLLYSPRDIAVMLWMMSHYIADAHMPFHCDNRGLASTSKQDTHGKVEELWGKQVAEIFHAKEILKETSAKILSAKPPKDSKFTGLDFGSDILPLKNAGDPWKEAVFICRASFATSFAWVSPTVAAVDSDAKVSLDQILTDHICGEDRFWEISQAIMRDASNAIARFWVDTWLDFTAKK